MKQEEFSRKLADAIPDMPEHYVHHVDMILEKIVAQEKNKTAVQKSPNSLVPFMGHYVSKRTRMILIALIVLMLSTTAYALTQWNIFEQLDFMFGKKISKEADKLMQENVHHQTINDVDITILEAGYDGRTLLMQYSYQFHDINEPLGVTAREYYGDGIPDGMNPENIIELKYDAQDIMNKYDVDWWTDEFWIDGKSVMMPSGSGSMDIGSHLPGEIIHTEYWRLDNENVSLSGIVEITLPVGNKEDGGITFMLDTRDALKKVKTTYPDYILKQEEFTARTAEAAFTPLMTYITLEGTDIVQTGSGNHPLSNAFTRWVYTLKLVDNKGKAVFTEGYGPESVSTDTANFYLPAVSDEKSELWLAPVYGDTADMLQAIKVR